jgi:hypothetical protein
MSDGELLTVLQHHAIPTRLIDVSRSALPALYFATETADRIDGRLFIVGLRIDPASGGYPTIQLAGGRGLPWRGAAVGLKYSSYEWTQTVASAEDVSLDPRMRAQHGLFLVGGMIKRYRGENLTVGGRLLPAETWPELSTLRVFFPMKRATKPTSARWPAIGWTVRIPAEWKDEVRSLLAARRYTRDHMYPDYDGCRRLGAFVAARAAEEHSG